MTRFFIIIFFCVIFQNLKSQIFPKDYDTLNIASFYFELPVLKNAIKYEVSVSTLDKKWNRKYQSDYPSIFVENLDFGNWYEWSYTVQLIDKKIQSKESYLFCLLAQANDRFTYRLNETRVKEILPFKYYTIEGLEGIFSSSGKLVFSPLYQPKDTQKAKSGLIVNPGGRYRDLRLEPDGTFSYIDNEGCRQIDFRNNTLFLLKTKNPLSWFYHHDFFKNRVGNSFCLYNEIDTIPINIKIDTAITNKKKYILFRNDSFFAKVDYGGIEQYNSKNELIWSWDSKKYLKRNDFEYLKDKNGLSGYKVHMNALAESQNHEFVYVSFRELSRIIKIQKSTHNVVDEWNGVGNDTSLSSFVFRNQHNLNVIGNDTLLFFSNNNNESIPYKDSTFSYVMMVDFSNKKVIRKWKTAPTVKESFSDRMGSVDILGNELFGVCLGINNRIFLMDKGEIVWQIRPEVIMPPTNEWKPVESYRAHFYQTLYPVYFTAYFKAETPFVKNIGIAKDKYTIRFFDKTQKCISSFDSKELKQNEEVKFIIPNEAFKIQISSIENPLFIKEIITLN